MDLFSRPGCAAAQRVRIALRLKRIPYVSRAMTALQEEVGETRLFSLGLTRESPGPVLLDQQRLLTRSLAIIEYLDELYERPTLIPPAARDRARVHALAEVAAVEGQALVNPSVLAYLREGEGFDGERLGRWQRHWLMATLTPLERMLRGNPATGAFCHGDSPTLADLYLFPLAAAAREQGLDLAAFPTVASICQRCGNLTAFSDTD